MKKPLAISCPGRHSLCRLLVFLTVLTTQLTLGGVTADSLYRIFINADPAKRIETVNELAQRLNADQIADTLYRCDKSTAPAKVEALMHYLMAEQYYDLEQYETALNEALHARELLKGGKPEKLQSDVLGLVSSAQYRIADYDEALKTMLEAYQIDKTLNDKKLISSDLNSLAAIYITVELPAQGIAFIEKAIAIERELGRPDRLAKRLGMASELYLLNNEPEKAMEAIEEAQEIDRSGGRDDRVAVRLVQKGAVLEYLGRDNEARAVILQALPVLEEAGISYSLAVAYNQLGAIEGRQGNTQKAIDSYKKALEQSVKCGSPKTERTAERGLWEMMRDSNPGAALLHLERYSTLNDSLLVETTATRAKILDITFHENEKTQIKKKNERIHDYIRWGGFLLVLMLAAMLIGLFYSRRKMKNALKIQHQTQEMRSHFLNNIANKLQAPLDVVMNAGEMLLANGKSDAGTNERLGATILSQGKNMHDLVNQMLDLNNVRNVVEEPDYKLGDIVLFVQLLVDNFKPQAHEKLIHMEFSSPLNSIRVVFVPDYIRKIVHNLLNNSIRFTPRNGTVTVSLTAPEDGHMKLMVSDTGVGIPVEERDHIFEPFSQSDNGYDGVSTSLELTLVYQLVQAMNGTITVDSEVDKGTTFTIDFPVTTDENNDGQRNDDTRQLAEEHIRLPEGMRHKPLVFIVENNDTISFFISSHLNEEYNLRFAQDGREALQNAQDMVPDLIITEINLPVMDGMTLIKQLRSNAAINHIPVIAMTSSTSDRTRMECIEAGADAVLIKPFKSDELRLAVRHLVTQRQMLRAHYTQSVTDEDSSAKTMSKEDKEFINKLIDIIHAQMAKDDIDMEHIAAALSMSRKQLRTRVMDLTGLTPVAYVLQVRLNHARQIITSSDTPLSTVANMCGFQNLSYFSRAFKQQFGVSPMQFRKRYENIHPG